MLRYYNERAAEGTRPFFSFVAFSELVAVGGFTLSMGGLLDNPWSQVSPLLPPPV